MAQAPLTRAQLVEAVEALTATGGRRDLAAERLGLHRQTFQHRIHQAKRAGLDIPPALEGGGLRKTPEQREAFRLERLERELRDLKEQNRRLADQAYTAESLKRLIHDCDGPRTPPKWRLSTRQAATTGVPLLFFSDWHWDEVVDPRQVNGVNAYNREIAERRCRHFFTRSIELLTQHMSRPNYEYAVLVLGGDLLSGNIHEELRETNEYPIAHSMLSILDHLIAGMTLLHEAFRRIYVPAVVGNHGRWDKKPRAKGRAYENFEWIVYQMLARHFAKESAIQFDIADGPDLPFRVFGTRYLLNHGDQARGGSGISGALAPLMLLDHRKRKRAMATGQDYDILLLGHWHQYLRFKGMIINGTGKGMDEWAASQNFEFEPPTQAVWITHPDHHITADWPIYLEARDARF